jgi:hypothetical protein
MWVNRTARYPYVSRETANTRAWLLMRNDPRSANMHKRRLAGLLLEHYVGRQLPQGTRELLGKWVLQYDDAHL